MNARGQRALVRKNKRQMAKEVSERPREADTKAEESSRGARWSSFTYSHTRCPTAAAAIPASIDLGMRLNIVNVKPPHLAHLEVESMKKFILDYKRYGQKFPRQLLWKMQQFILEDQLEVICDEDGREYEDIVELEKEEFIQIILRLHQANSSRKWKNQIYLNTYIQYMEDFKFWVLAAGYFPEKEIVKIFVSGIKPDIFREWAQAWNFSWADLFAIIWDICWCNCWKKTWTV